MKTNIAIFVSKVNKFSKKNIFKLNKDLIRNIKKLRDGNFFFITTNLSFFFSFSFRINFC